MRVHQVHTVRALSALSVPLIPTSTSTALQRANLVLMGHTPVARPLVASRNAKVQVQCYTLSRYVHAWLVVSIACVFLSFFVFCLFWRMNDALFDPVSIVPPNGVNWTVKWFRALLREHFWILSFAWFDSRDNVLIAYILTVLTQSRDL